MIVSNRNNTQLPKMNETLAVLLLEDNEDHAALVSRSLRGKVDHQLNVQITHKTRLRDALSALRESSFDIVICDLKLPDSPLELTLPAILNEAGDLPVVVLTAMDDSELGTNLVKQGAQDFLVKSAINGPLITRSVLYAIERKQAELQQRAHAEQLEALVAERTSHLELLLSVADVSDQAHSVRDALQQTIDHICTSLNMQFGIALLLPEPSWTSAQDIGVEFQSDSAATPERELRAPAHRGMLQQRAIEDKHVVVDRTSEAVTIVLPIVAGPSVPALLEFWTDSLPADISTLVSVMERIRTQIGRVFERDQLQRAIEESVHVEQQSLIGELHDGLGHELSGLTWQAHSHLLNLEEAGSDLAAGAADLHSGLRRSLGLLRQSLRGMTSLQLGADGFVPALASLVREADRRSDCRFEFDCRSAALPLPEFTAAQVYRIVQESLTNVGKHSKAANACVTVLFRNERLTVSVSDDGRGVVGADGIDNGLGFGIMRHRARLIGGDLSIREATLGGLQVILEAPVHLQAT